VKQHFGDSTAVTTTTTTTTTTITAMEATTTGAKMKKTPRKERRILRAKEPEVEEARCEAMVPDPDPGVPLVPDPSADLQVVGDSANLLPNRR